MIEQFWSNVDGEVEAAFLQHVCHFDPAPTPTWNLRVWGSDIADNYRRFSFLVSYPENMPDPKKPELCKEWKPRDVLGERLQPVWDKAVARYWREREQVRQMKFRDELLQKKGYRPLSWLVHHDAEKKKRAKEEAVEAWNMPEAKKPKVKNGREGEKVQAGTQQKGRRDSGGS